MGIAFTYRDVKGTPLTDEEIDANWRAADAAFDAVQQQIFLVDRFEADVDEGVFEVFLTDGRSSGPIPMPPRPFRFRGDWAPGVPYLDGDLFVVRKSTVRVPLGVNVDTPAGLYRATVAHTTTTLLDDRQDGKIELALEAGENATHFEGAWATGAEYTANSVVMHNLTQWQCYVDVEAGKEPGVDFDSSGDLPMPYWFSLTSPPRRLVKAAWEGKPAAGAASPRDLIDQPCVIQLGFPGSLARLETASSTGTGYSIRKNGTEIGFVGFAPGSQIGVFGTANSTLLTAPIVPGDRLQIVAPTPQDANAASPTITLVLTVIG